MTSHSVGGSSSTGAKLSARIYRGSTEGLIGGFMKLLIKSSKALNNLAGRDGSTRLVEETLAIAGEGGDRRGKDDGDGESASGGGVFFLAVCSVRTE